MPKVGFVSLGCPKNLVDSEVMMGILARAGYELTPRADDAEVIVVNTCSFIAPAQQESVETILEMAEHKKFGAAKKLIVAGCLVERFRAQILEEIPEVDAVIGTGEVEGILAACRGELARDASAQADDPSSYLYHEMTPRILSTPRHTAYLKIAEGCDHPCSFCIIPQLRGRFRSRRFESVVREAENLARAGVREVTLIGQDTTFYGEDLGLRDGLAVLLERLAQIEELDWVRFLYCYPNRVTPRLLETIAAQGSLAVHRRLAAVDPVAAGKIHPHDVRRIVRAPTLADPDAVVWNPTTRTMEASRLDGVDAVVHLAGESIIGRWTRARRRYDIMRQCQAAGIIAAVVQSAEDRVEYDPQLQHREMFPIIEHPELGECPYEGYPPKLSRTPAFVHGRAPLLAEHNQYVYGELLGMSATEIAGLRERGVI